MGTPKGVIACMLFFFLLNFFNMCNGSRLGVLSSELQSQFISQNNLKLLRQHMQTTFFVPIQA